MPEVANVDDAAFDSSESNVCWDDNTESSGLVGDCSKTGRKFSRPGDTPPLLSEETSVLLLPLLKEICTILALSS